jgi:hypothetical protein
MLNEGRPFPSQDWEDSVIQQIIKLKERTNEEICVCIWLPGELQGKGFPCVVIEKSWVVVKFRLKEPSGLK